VASHSPPLIRPASHAFPRIIASSVSGIEKKKMQYMGRMSSILG
jgi:hypothetical protein